MRRACTVIGPHGEVAHRKPLAGDLSWDGDAWRRWTGRRWTIAAYSLHPERLRSPERLDRHKPVARDARSRALDLAVQDQVITRGATVVHQGPGGVVLGYRKPVSHGFHAVLTIITGGLWGFVWLALAGTARQPGVPRGRPLGQRMGEGDRAGLNRPTLARMHEMAVAARVVGHIGAFNEAVSSGDWARFAEHFTPDATMTFPDLPVPAAHGRDAILASYVASPPDDGMVALGATTDEETDHVEFAWSRGGTGQMWITWDGDLVAALEVRFG